jgi:SAM-dependent methyltransferase
MELEVLDQCPLCQSRRLRSWRPAPDRAYGNTDLGCSYARCLDCDARFLRRRPTAATIGELYDDRYEPYDVGGARRPPPAEFGQERPSRLPAAWLDLVRPLYQAPSSGARFLDLGCGSAYFLAAAGRAGWRAIGADFSVAVVERARAGGFEAHAVDEVWPVLAEAPVDVVRMNHVLEHVYDPVEMLSRVRDVLRPGGSVHIAVPNPVGLSSSLFHRHWLGLEPRHLILFPPRLLRSVLTRAGFKVVAIGHQPSPADVRRSAGYALQWLGLPSRVCQAVASPMADQVYAVPASLAALLGRGDRIHVVARR